MTTERAEISTGRKVSGIWAIPILALVLGLYMVFHNWMTEGPQIEIAFKTASGLEEGKTKIKYRNVVMGAVDKVRLNHDLDGVIAEVKLERQALTLLRDDTSFWVVTARVGAGNISGLDTLLSGAYIQLAPGSGKEGKRKFVGLEKPPLTPAEAPGLRLHLTSQQASSIDAGDIILYKGYKVGRVESRNFNISDRLVHYEIFIDAPYDELVNSNVYFWDVSGVSLSANASGFKVETGSLETVFLGGVAFGMHKDVKAGSTVASETTFDLHSSYDDTLANPFKHGTYYVVSFSQSIKGLLPGAPVEYRGILIGEVERVLLKESLGKFMPGEKEGNGDAPKFENQGKGGPIPILIYVEPGRMELPDKESSIAAMREAIKTGVSNGLRATLESGNLITGAKYINLDYFSDAPEAKQGSFLEYTTIPTMETGLLQIEQKVNAILDTINSLPLQDTVASAEAAIQSLNEGLQTLNSILEQQSTQQLPEQLNKTLQELSETLSGLTPNSAAYQSLNSSLLSLNRTMSNLEILTRKLSDQPNAVVLPSSTAPDPVPEASKQ